VLALQCTARLLHRPFLTPPKLHGLVVCFIQDKNKVVSFLRIVDFTVKDNSHAVYTMDARKAFLPGQPGFNQSSKDGVQIDKKANFIILHDPSYWSVVKESENESGQEKGESHYNPGSRAYRIDEIWANKALAIAETVNGAAMERITMDKTYTGAGGVAQLKRHFYDFYEDIEKGAKPKECIFKLLESITGEPRANSLTQKIILYICELYYPQCKRAFQRILQLQLCEKGEHSTTLLSFPPVISATQKSNPNSQVSF
tara:strand:+ start:303 stop:1073 length:771 start_codon:yes stop_codon:yes gene_type:complete